MSKPDAKIISPSEPKKPKVPPPKIVGMTSERALREFQVACEIWLDYMTPEDRAKAAELARAP